MCYSMFPHFEDKEAAIRILARYLKKDGRFVICHSQSREVINNLHNNEMGLVQSSVLQQAEQIARYYNQAGLETVTIIDNEDMFVVIGRKI